MRKVGQKVDFEHPELERDLKLKKKKNCRRNAIIQEERLLRDVEG